MTSSSGIHAEVGKRLTASGIRYTTGRRAVIDALARSDGPMSAAELHATMGAKVPLSSIYRAIAVLESAEVLVPHLATKGIARYEPAEWLGGHHHHLVCIDCGSVEDIPIAPGPETRLEQIVTELAGDSQFEPVDHALEIAGRCHRCA